MNHRHIASTLLLLPLLLGGLACGKKAAPLLQPPKDRPGSANYLCSEGMRLLNSGDMAQAGNRFQAALAKDPNHADATLGLGIVHLNSREFESSLACFERLKQLTPDSLDVYNYLGIIYMELQRYDRAREHLLIAATSSKYETPENAYANLALLELKQNNLEAAMRYIGKGLEKKKSFALLHSLAGRVYQAQKKLPEALASYERASSILFGNDLGLLMQIARIHAQMGNRDKAMDLLESSLGKAGTDQERQAVLNLIAEINQGG